MPELCSLCEAEDASESFPICTKCAAALGLREFPPSRRPPVPCTRCNGERFVRVMPREYTGGLFSRSGSNLTKVDTQYAAPMALTVEPETVERTILKGRSVEPPSILNGLGALETYVCCACGFVEWYCQDPEAIPIGPEYNTELVDYTPKTPYR